MTGNKPMISKLKRAPLIVAALLSMILTSFVSLPAVGQEISPEHLALARKYLDLTDHSGVFEATVVQAGINTFKTLSATNPDITEALNKAITDTITEYKGHKGDLFDQMARVYALTFSPEELQQIVDFYGSPIGMKLSKANAELNSTMQRIMNVYSVNLSSEFFAKVRAALKKAGIDT